MGEALELAREAGAAGEIPVGALLIGPGGEVLARARNARPVVNDPTAHAEIVAIRAAAEALGTPRLDGCTLVVTLEPCTMCAGAVLQARLSRLVFGAWDEKAGAVGGRLDVIRESGLPHRVEVVAGVRAEESTVLLRDFFAARR
jgi:tRNA(adenine34) deaminase